MDTKSIGKYWIKYCLYSSIILALDSLFIMVSSDSRLEAFYPKAIFSIKSFQWLSVIIFLYCFIHQFLLVLTGLVLVFNRNNLCRGVILIVVSLFFFWTVF